MDSEDSNLVPHACTARTSAIVPSPQSLKKSYKVQTYNLDLIFWGKTKQVLSILENEVMELIIPI
jgi:hypothetical protein